MRFPLYTNELTQCISDEFNRVYEANNSSFTYDFKDAAIEEEYREYLSETDFQKHWRETSLYALINNINSIIVIDLPREGQDINPYFFFIDIATVKDVGVNPDGSISYLIVMVNDKTIAVYDDSSYRLFTKVNGSSETWREVVKNPHRLGYTPACFFWDESLDERKILKKSPFTGSLNNLDWLLFWETSRRMLEMYAAYPIYSTYEERCSYYEMVEGSRVECTDGFLYFPNASRPSECPSCAKRKFIGPGTLLRIPTPRSRDDADLRDPVSVKPAETASLEYSKQRQVELWDDIYGNVAGWGAEAVAEAINEKQVRSGFESKQNVMMGIAHNLEKSHQFVVSTIADLKYGESFVYAKINYGNQFYIIEESEATVQYKNVKDAGVPMYILSEKRNLVESITSRNNEQTVRRVNVLKALEPWPDLSLSEVKAAGLNIMMPVSYLVKADFSRLIGKFEQEYGSIVDFGSAISFSSKIEKINQILIQYVERERQQVAGDGNKESVGATYDGGATTDKEDKPGATGIRES